MGVAETEKALRVEVLEVCRFYFLQVWNEALYQAGVGASSALKRAENVYYLPAICALVSLSSKPDSVSKEADECKGSPSKALPIANISSEVVEQSEDAENAVDTTKEVAEGAPYLQMPPKSPLRRKRLPKTWRLCWQLFPYPLRKTSEAKDLHLPRRPPPSLLRLIRISL